MPRNIAILFIIGIAIVLGAGYGSYALLKNARDEVQAGREKLNSLGNTATVVVLSRDLARGSVITADLLRSETISTSALPQNVIRDLADLQTDEGPLMARRPLTAGQLLLDSDIGYAGAGSAKDLILPVNSQAFGFRPQNYEIFADILAVDDRVDVYWRQRQSNGIEVTRAIATSLRVAATGRSTTASGTEVRAETAPQTAPEAPAEDAAALIVTGSPQEIAILIEAAAEGELYVVPCNQSHDADVLEQDHIVVDEATLAALPYLIPPARAVARADPAPTNARPENTVSQTNTGLQTDATARARPANMQDILQDLPEIGRANCKLSVVRAAARSSVNVPC